MRIVHDLIGWWHRITAFARRRRIAREVDEELAFHLAMREADARRDGAPADDAARHARRQFGNLTLLTEDTRGAWTFPSLESIMKDIRFALRTLRKAPGFTFVAVLALAIGIGANTAIFSLVDAMLVRGLPYSQPDRLVLLIGTVRRTEVERRGNSYPDFVDWRDQSTAFDGMAAYFAPAVTISGDGDTERLNIEAVSAPYFDILDVQPVLGRTFRSDEDEVGGPAVTILSHALWARRFGRDPAVLGRQVRLNTTTYDVIGVMPPGVAGLSDGAEAWIPFTISGWPLEQRGARGFQAVARLTRDVSLEQAQSQLDTISARLEREYPNNEGRAVEVSPLSVETFGELRPAVLALMAAVTFVLLIACANVANLLIGRSETRQREIAVRTAMGAGRWRLLRQLVTESLVLSGLGALAGLGLASLAVPALIAASPVSVPSFATPSLSLPVLAFTAGVALVCGLLLGIAPAMHARVSRLGDVLKGSARGSSGTRSRVRATLVVVEVSLAVVLLVGAGLMIRTVQNLTAIDPGFDTGSILAFTISIPQDETAAVDGAPLPFVTTGRDLIERLEAVPGVGSASLVTDMPLTGGGSAIFYAAEGDTTTDAQTRPRAYVHRVSPGFFDTMGVTLTAGRPYLESELTPDSTSIIVSERVVNRFWPGQDPLGKRVKQGSIDSSAPWLTIIGVVPELKYRALPENPTTDPDLYFPYVDRGVQAVMLRTDVDPVSVVGSVRAAIREISPNIVVYDVSPMDERVSAMTSQSQFTTWLMGLFAATALLLAVVGIYGVMSYLVTQRRREFGIRLALGAGSREIIATVLGHGLKFVALGLAIGIGAAALLSRLVTSLLYGVETTDLSGAVAVGLLGFVAFLACLVPAYRATRVDPVEALRAE